MGRFPETDNDPFFPALRLLPHSNRAEHLEQAKRFQLKPRYPCRHMRTWNTKTPFLSFFCSGSNVALQEFLHARNPKNQHSGTLESYLIKPIQVNVLALQENNVTLIVAYGDV